MGFKSQTYYKKLTNISGRIIFKNYQDTLYLKSFWETDIFLFLEILIVTSSNSTCLMLMFSLQVSLDQYHTEEEIYQMSLQREPRKSAVRYFLLVPSL